MAFTDSRIKGGGANGTGRFVEFTDWVHRNLLWLLIASYVLAGVFPGPGRMIRGLSLTRATGDDVTAPMMLLALLLFCAAAVVRWSQLRKLM